MSSQKKSSRLEGKDLITVVIVMLVAMLGFIPIFIPLMAVLCPLIGGIPYMLYVTKAKKFGMTAIMGFLIGLIMVFFGNGYLTMVTGLVGGLLADVILKKADYKSAKSTVLSCGVFSIWVFGNFAPIFLNRESYMVMLTEGYGAEYAATLNTYMPMWIAPILLVACFVFGLVGGMIGKAICKKHFQRHGWNRRRSYGADPPCSLYGSGYIAAYLETMCKSCGLYCCVFCFLCCSNLCFAAPYGDIEFPRSVYNRILLPNPSQCCDCCLCSENNNGQ